MRVSNVVIGFLLAIAIAYIHDAATTRVSADGEVQNIVNWDVLGRAVAGVTDWTRDEFDKLNEQFHRPG